MVGISLYVYENAKKWNEETCREEAKKYKTRGEFAKGNVSAYDVARKNGWLDSYEWFEKKRNRDYYKHLKGHVITRVKPLSLYLKG